METGLTKAIKYISYGVFILGTIGSFVLSMSSGDEINYMVFVIGIVSTIISGVLLLGLSKIIQLLENISHYSKCTFDDVRAIRDRKDNN